MKNLNVRNALVAVMMLGLVGCASVGSVGNNVVSNKSEGLIYGYSGIVTSENELAEAFCKSTKNTDERCNNPNEYLVAPVWSKLGFADGSVGTVALIKKDFPDIEALKHEMRTGNSKAPYVKAILRSGKFGEIVDIVSKDGDGKCYWSGMPRVGGVVCPAYNYDYRKDYIGVVLR